MDLMILGIFQILVINLIQKFTPLQGVTDFRFRNAFQQYFGGIDTFYSPYILLNGTLNIKQSYQNDIDPANNTTLEVIPQIITNDAEEFLFVAVCAELGLYRIELEFGLPLPDGCQIWYGLWPDLQSVEDQ